MAALDDPGDGQTPVEPTDAGPSWPVLIDPIGYTEENSAKGATWGRWVGGVKGFVARRTWAAAPQNGSVPSRLRLTTLQDDIVFAPNATPDTSSGFVQCGNRYTASWLIQRTRNADRSSARLWVLAFQGRPATDVPADEQFIALTSGTTNSVTIDISGGRPPLKKDGWVMLVGTPTNNPTTHAADFYRVTSLTEQANTPSTNKTALTLQLENDLAPASRTSTWCASTTWWKCSTAARCRPSPPRTANRPPTEGFAMRVQRTRRAGFTLTELLVAAALCMFIMTILGQAFGRGMATMSLLRTTGQMQDKLRSASNILKRDLNAAHFDGPFQPGLSGPYLSDQRLDLSGWTPPAAGFFHARQGYVNGSPTYYEAPDADGVYSSRATQHLLHFTVVLPPGADDLFSAAAPSDQNLLAAIALPAGGLFASRRAEVCYYLQPNALDLANGTNMYTLRAGSACWPRRRSP